MLRLPQGKYPRGHDVASSEILSAVNAADRINILMIIKNSDHIFPRKKRILRVDTKKQSCFVPIFLREKMKENIQRLTEEAIMR